MDKIVPFLVHTVRCFGFGDLPKPKHCSGRKRNPLKFYHFYPKPYYF